jgi:nitroimidazol reductase NimA-like FMN-containing flavoprotein (pyridoxamine 5'-phosphate oxidase superfamily)
MIVEVDTRLQQIPGDECLRLLTENHLGRLAVVDEEGQPLVFPVNYAFWARRVVFRTDPGTKLHTAEGRRVAFEIDGADALYHEGWSVLVQGTAREEHDPTRIREFSRLPLRAWAAGPKAHWLYIEDVAISGRRIVHAAEKVEDDRDD